MGPESLIVSNWARGDVKDDAKDRSLNGVKGVRTPSACVTVLRGVRGVVAEIILLHGDEV